MHELALTLQKSADLLLAAYEGLTFARLQVLRALLEAEAISQHALAQAIGIDDAALSRMLPGLLRQGWVQVEADPAHGRRRLVQLTEEGRAVCQQASAALDTAFAGVSYDAGIDAQRLVTDLQALSQQIRQSMSRQRPGAAKENP